ncbi:MAG TPA: phage holin family protein [Nocardioides sp.]|nr:phage holin family protein [Nocardioides sp.]
MRFLTWLITNALALAAAAWLFDGIRFAGPTSGQAELGEKLLPLLAVALILGLVSGTVKPVLTFLSLPVVVLTLGLFLLVINAAVLALTSWLAAQLDLGFHVDGFWTAVGGALVITVVTRVVDSLIGRDERR